MPSAGRPDKPPAAALRDGGPDRLEHTVPLEQHLVVVEAEHDIPAHDEAGIGFQVAATVGGSAVMGESVDLRHERPPDEAVHGMPVDPDLLPDGDARPAEPVDEAGLQTGVGERGDDGGECGGALRTAQIVSLLLLAIGVAGLVINHRRALPPPAAKVPAPADDPGGEPDAVATAPAAGDT